MIDNQRVILGQTVETPYGPGKVNEIHRVDDLLTSLKAKLENGEVFNYTVVDGWETREQQANSHWDFKLSMLSSTQQRVVRNVFPELVASDDRHLTDSTTVYSDAVTALFREAKIELTPELRAPTAGAICKKFGW